MSRWLLGSFCLLVSFHGLGQGPLSEAQIKAAFVLNFVRYVEWPERAFSSKDSPLTICLIGRDDGAIALAPLDGRKAQDRPIKVRFDVGPDAAGSCHVAFISETESRRVPTLLRGVKGLPVLTVSDAEGFIDQGGAIGMVRGEQRLQFEVNRTAIERAQLKASSHLLKLARAVLSPGG